LDTHYRSRPVGGEYITGKQVQPREYVSSWLHLYVSLLRLDGLLFDWRLRVKRPPYRSGQLAHPIVR